MEQKSNIIRDMATKIDKIVNFGYDKNRWDLERGYWDASTGTNDLIKMAQISITLAFVVGCFLVGFYA